MSELTDLLTLVAVLTAIQFVARSLRNLRDAIRLVPIGSIKPSMVREYKTVPLCFVGGMTVLANAFCYVYGRLWIRPRARKQAALCDRVLFLDDQGTHRPQCHNVEAGMLVQATLSGGENSRHVRRSARRSKVGSELILAILFQTNEREEYAQQVRCISVRARARSTNYKTNILPPRVIEWEVVDPAGIGSRTDYVLTRREVPHDAFWLVSQELQDEIPVQHRLGRVFYPYGSTRWRGLLSLCVMIVAEWLCFVIVTLTITLIYGMTDTRPNLLYLFVALVMVVWIYRLLRYVWERFAPERFRTQGPTARERVRFRGMSASVYYKLEWHGSTRRSLAVGDRIRKAGFWQQIDFNYWSKLISSIKDGIELLKKSRH